MIRPGLRSTLLVCAVAALAWPACATDPAPGTPAAAAEGERLMRQMSDTLARAHAFRFTTSEQLDRIGPDAARGVWRFTRTVTVRRPDAMAFHLTGGAETPVQVAGFYDGRTVSLRDVTHGTWARADEPGTLDEMLDQMARKYSLPVPIADVVYRDPYSAFIGPDTTGGFVGRETLDGTACARLAYADDLVDLRVWLPTAGDPLPRRVELVYKQVVGAPMARIDFTSWDLSPRLADNDFAFAPSDAGAEVAFEHFVTAMLEGRPMSSPVPGAPRPD